MLGIFLMMIFGKLQDYVGRNMRAWHWALLYTVLGGLIRLAMGGPVDFIGLLLTGLYAWGYFALLQRVSDNLGLWLAVYLLMPLLPIMLLPMILAS